MRLRENDRIAASETRGRHATAYRSHLSALRRHDRDGALLTSDGIGSVIGQRGRARRLPTKPSDFTGSYPSFEQWCRQATQMGHSTRIFLSCIGVMFAVWTLWCALMAFVGEPFTLPYLRAVVRVSAVLLPAIVYARFGIEHREDFWAFRRNWQLGLLVGTILSGLFCVMIVVQNSGRRMVIPVEIPVWINFIVLSPLAEELMFRRVVLEYLKSLTTTSRAIIGASILFSLFHLPWWLMSGEQQGYALAMTLFSLFLYGVVFSVAVHTTQSIWSAVIPHWINNLLIMSLIP